MLNSTLTKLYYLVLWTKYSKQFILKSTYQSNILLDLATWRYSENIWCSIWSVHKTDNCANKLKSLWKKHSDIKILSFHGIVIHLYIYYKEYSREIQMIVNSWNDQSF